MNVWGADVTGTINFGSASGSTKIEGSTSSGTGTVTYTDTGEDSQGNTWTITTITSTGKSFTQNASYSQVGSSNKPVTSITFTTTLTSAQTIKAFSAKFGGFSNTAGTVTLKVGETSVGSGSLNGTSDVTVSATNTTTSGTVLTVTVTNIAKGVKCYYISYTYDDGTASSIVATPTISVETGTYTTAQNVTLACDTEGATIHYTMTVDGTTPDDPSESDATYSTAISVTKSGTIIKAKAFKNGMTASSVVTATYTIKPNKPTITAAGATVTITADDGCDIYYTTNNANPSKSSTHYTGPFNLDDDCQIKAVAYDAYDNSSDFQVLSYVYLPLAPKNINSNHYVKVTDVNTLENGDAVLIVCENDNVAMSTEQNNNNRGEEAVTINGNIIDSPSSNVQKLVLMKIGNYFYFYTGTGYLYAASSSSNYLKTETTPDDDNNAKAEIAISSGDATITFQGKNTHNVLKHNGSNSLFSCYLSSSEQDAVQIYKEIPTEPSQPTVDDVAHTVTLTTTANMEGWRTFAPVKADQNYTADADVYYVSAAGTSTVTLVKIDEGVPANTPVILHKTSGTNIILTETDNPIAAPGSNLLAVSTAGDNLGTVYRLGYKSAHGVGFYTYTTNSAPAGIIYLTSINAAHEFLGLDFDGETTGVNEVTNTNLTNNTNEFYNLAGQRVAQPTKGLYIVNGRKVIIK